MLKTFIIPRPTTLPDNSLWYVVGCDDLLTNWPIFNREELNDYTIGTLYALIAPKILFEPNSNGIVPNYNLHCVSSGSNLDEYIVYEKEIKKDTVIDYDGNYGIPFKLDLTKVDFNNQYVCIVFQGNRFRNLNVGLYVPELESQMYVFKNADELQESYTDESFSEFHPTGDIPFWLGGDYWSYEYIETDDLVSPNAGKSTKICSLNGFIGNKSIESYSMDDDPDYYSVPSKCVKYSSDDELTQYLVEVRVPYEYTFNYGTLYPTDGEYYSDNHNCDSGNTQNTVTEGYQANFSDGEIDIFGIAPDMMPDSYGAIIKNE